MLVRGSVLLMVALAGMATADDLKDFFKKSGKKKAELKPCYGDTRFKSDKDKPICQHLGFRFCMRLVKDSGEPYIFGGVDSENSTERDEDTNNDGLDWWEWSTQPQHKKEWLAGIVATGGHHWCTCALCTSEAVDRFGCDNLDIKCDATDMAFIRYRVEHDGHKVLQSGLDCLIKKCGKDYQKDWPIVGHDCKHRGCARLYGEGYEHALMPLLQERPSHVTIGLGVAAFAAFVMLFAVGLRLGRSTSQRQPGPLLVVEEELVAQRADAIE